MMMKAPAKKVGDGLDIDFDLDGDGGGASCDWTDDVCTATPTMYVEYQDDGHGHLNVLTFCERHYVLTVAYLLEVHLLECTGTARAHIKGFGSLAELD